MIVELRRLVRRTLVLRTAEPALAAVWHAWDRGLLAYDVRRRVWQLRHRHDRPAPLGLRVGFTPELPRPWHMAYRLCVRLDVSIVSPAAAEVVVHWQDATIRDSPTSDLPAGAVNAGVCDISKRHVDALHREVFGYDLRPDPGAQALVEKSDQNAWHDGRVVAQASGDPGRVVQRLIDNRVNDDIVVDLRVGVAAGRVAFLAARYRLIWDRFHQGDGNLVAVLHPPAAFLTDDEQALLVEFCRAAGADCAELDVLRDRTSGRLYVVDLNPTPSAPITRLRPENVPEYWRLAGEAWREELVAHARLAAGAHLGT